MFPTTYAHHVQLLCCSVAHKHHRMFLFISYNTMSHATKFVTGQLKCDGTRAENRFRLLAKRTSPFKSAGVSAQSTTGSQGVRISVSNDGYTMFRGSVKCTGYPLHSSFPFISPPVRHLVPSHFNWSLPSLLPHSPLPVNTMLRPWQELPLTVETTMLDTFCFLPTVLLCSIPICPVSQLKELITSKGYHCQTFCEQNG